MVKQQVKKWQWHIYLMEKPLLLVGTHTHVPTSDHRVMEKGHSLSNRYWNVWRL